MLLGAELDLVLSVEVLRVSGRPLPLQVPHDPQGPGVLLLLSQRRLHKRLDQGHLPRGQAHNGHLVFFTVKRRFCENAAFALEDERLGQAQVGQEGQLLKIVGEEE